MSPKCPQYREAEGRSDNWSTSEERPPQGFMTEDTAVSFPPLDTYHLLTNPTPLLFVKQEPADPLLRWQEL